MNLILSKKHESWVESIKDPAVKDLAAKNTIITGGAIASMLLKEEIHDFDFYFTNFETCKAVAEYYVQQFIKEHDNLKIIPQVVIEDEITGKIFALDGTQLNKKEDAIETLQITNDSKLRVRIRIQSAGIVGDKTNDKEYQYFEGNMQNGSIDESLMPAGEEYVDEALESPEETLRKADEIKADDPEKFSAVGNLCDHQTEKGKFRPVFLSDNAISLSDKVQLIIRFYGNIEEIHKNFDFVHATNFWQSDTKELTLQKEALESLITKRLYYMNSLYPICALIRMRKFIQRGFFVDAGQILKICFQISKLNLEDINVLESQLTGVDQQYFCQLVNYIQQEKSKNENWILDLPYLISIVDKIFG
jgi:hypothetical protein